MRCLALAVSIALLAAACEPHEVNGPDGQSVSPPLFSFHSGAPDELSPTEDLARNATGGDYPTPLGSDAGWGGGAKPWDIVDGRRIYPGEWARGLAFTGGTLPWVAPCGWRQATIDFGQPTTFNRVVVWHHGLDHVPNTYKIQYWDGSGWVDVFSTTSGHDFLMFPSASPSQWWESWSTPTDNTFEPVTATKVRFALNNCDITHGWIYEFEVYLEPLVIDVTIDIKPGSDPNSINCKNTKGVIPVAILTTDDFDATTVDHTTVAFGPSGATEIHTNRSGVARHEEDVDGDGDTDLVFHFRFGDTGLACVDTEATLTGSTSDGTEIVGTDAIRIVGR